MLAYEFMRNAFLAATFISILCGMVGYFLIVRQQSFAAHALSHVGFAGATGAALIGIPVMAGLLVFTAGAGILMGGMEKIAAERRDVVTGLVLSLSLGIGVLFLYFYPHYASQVTALMFGNIFAIDIHTVGALFILCVVCCLCIMLMARGLLFVSLVPEIAQSQGYSLTVWSMTFLIIVAIAVSSCTQITGILLVFTLLIGPAASAAFFVLSPFIAMGVSVVFALMISWGAIYLSWYSNWPVSFWVSFLSACLYGVCIFIKQRKISFRSFALKKSS